MDINYLISQISKKFNINYNELDNFVKTLNEEKQENPNIILPFCGLIIQSNCKGIIYNHGLYTQCTTTTDKEYCYKCNNNKYGNINDRANFKLGEFVTKNGKKEIDYNKFIKKMNYKYEDVVNLLRKNNLTYPLLKEPVVETKKSRGRPKKKICNLSAIKKEESDEEIEVTRVTIDGTEYLKTEDDVILDKSSYDIIGMYNEGKIEMIRCC